MVKKVMQSEAERDNKMDERVGRSQYFQVREDGRYELLYGDGTMGHVPRGMIRLVISLNSQLCRRSASSLDLFQFC